MENVTKPAKYWRSGLKLLLRIGLILILQTIAIVVIALIPDNIEITNIATALLVAIVISLLNAIFWPLLMRLTLPIVIYTFGLASLFLNGLIIYFTSEIIDGFSIKSFWTAIGMAFSLTILNLIFSWLFSIDDQSSYYKNVVKRFAKRSRGTKVKDTPGVVFAEIDGLSRPTLEKAIELGYANNLKKWLETKSHTLEEWETDLSCQTGASQCGILHGSNDNMPAFRWVEKENDNRIIASSGPVDTPIIESRHSDGKGLLAQNGGSRGNLLSGDAQDALFTFSKMNELGKLYNPIFYAYFSHPYNYIRTIVLYGWDVILEYRSRIRQHRKDIQPRLGKDKRGGIYPLVRAFTTVLLREVITYTLIGDIYEGEKDAVYVTFMGYDEVAHHSGVEDIDAFKALNQIDKQLGRINAAIAESPRKYKLVILSDHGQSKGATFKQRYGLTLEELTKKSIDKDLDTHGVLDNDEDLSFLNMVLTNLVNDKDKVVGKISSKILSKKTDENQNVIIGKPDKQIDPTKQMPKIIVLASGNLGLIYFTDWKHRLMYEDIEKYYPSLINDIVSHEGIGFAMVNTKKNGGVVFGGNGKYILETDTIEGENPLADFRETAPMHLRRTNSFKYTPDILVNSFYDKEKDEIAAFEELIGAHGGMGGNQSRPFVFYPSELEYPEEKVISAENLHTVLKSWVV